MLGWLGRLVVLFALLGVLAYDGVKVMTTHFGAADDAATASREAVDAYQATKDVQQAYDAAVRSLDGKGDTVETATFTVNPDGSIDLVVVKSVSTLWMKRVGFLKDYTEVRQSGHSTPV